MTLQEFKKRRIKGRERLLQKILEVFKELTPVAIHQFGSGAYGYKDEFSDLDIWITFEDNKIEQVVRDQKRIFKSMAPILIQHKSKKNSPIGGSATLVIYNIEQELFQVDYYLSKLSETVIKDDAKILFGDDTLIRGEWRLDKEASERKSLQKRITFLVVMAFISIKGVIREWKSPEFENTIETAYKKVGELSKSNLKPLPQKLSFELIYSLLDNLAPLTNREQKKALETIDSFTKTVQTIYK